LYLEEAFFGKLQEAAVCFRAKNVLESMQKRKTFWCKNKNNLMQQKYEKGKTTIVRKDMSGGQCFLAGFF